MSPCLKVDAALNQDMVLSAIAVFIVLAFIWLHTGRRLHSSTFQLNVSTFCPMWWFTLLVSVTKTAQVEHRCGRV